MMMTAGKAQAILMRRTMDRAHPINVSIEGITICPSEVLTQLGIRFGNFNKSQAINGQSF